MTMTGREVITHIEQIAEEYRDEIDQIIDVHEELDEGAEAALVQYIEQVERDLGEEHPRVMQLVAASLLQIVFAAGFTIVKRESQLTTSAITDKEEPAWPTS